MNYANLGFAQIDFTGVDTSQSTAQQGIAGNYSKCIDAINNGKIIVIVNMVYDDIKYSPSVVSGNDDGEYITLSTGTNDYYVYPDDKIQVH